MVRRREFSRTTFVVTLFVGCLLSCGVANASPSITLSKKSGPPTSRILVSGSGFDPNVNAEIYFGSKDEKQLVTDGQGAFENAEIHAPRTALPGKHLVKAVEQNNLKSAQQPFLVQTNWSQFHFGADHDALNPYEHVLNVNNVGNLGWKWSYSVGFPTSPAVANGVVYVGSASDYNLYALNARTGAKLWSFRTGDNVGSTPAIADGIVYFGSFDKNVYALNARTGAKLWSYATGAFVNSSPAVVGATVYVGSDGVYALNAKTGTLLWKASTGYVQGSPAVAKGAVYVGSEDGNVYAFDAGTGTKLWSYATLAYISSPAVAAGVVYMGSEDSNVYALNARTGVKIWSYTTGYRVRSTPAVANGVVYFSSEDGNLYALDARTGAKVWVYTTSYMDLTSSPAIANGIVYFGYSDYYTYFGHIYALKADTGAVLWTSTKGSYWIDPAVVDGVVYASGAHRFFAFGLPRGGEAK
jgi:outer membrane protein assembly factor BamB